MSESVGYNDAAKLAQKVVTRRVRELARLEAFVLGTQYANRPNFFAEDVPLWERAPCIVLPIVKSAIQSNVDLCLGETRFPFARTGDEALDEALMAVAKNARIEPAAREMLATAEATRSAAAIVGVRASRLFVDVVKAEWCTPKLDRDGAVLSLEIRYVYIEERVVGSEKRAVPLWYRRVIDAVNDTTFLPAEIKEGTEAEPSWRVDASQTVAHGLGFCPVVWYPHLKGCSIVGQVDGRALHDNVLDEIEGLDMALSQRHRAALYAGDPQWTEIGVTAGHNPTGTGRTARVLQQSSRDGGPATADNPAHRGGYVDIGGRSRAARKKGPGQVWQYPDKDTKVTLHTLPGDALKALDDHIKDLRHKVAEALGVVFLDLDNMPKTSSMSGRFVEAFKRPQYARCDQIRADFGDHGLLPLWAMAFRVALATGVLADANLPTPAWKSWHCPPIDLVWGSYRLPESEEKVQEIASAIQAKDGGLATTKVAVTMVRGILGIENVDDYLDELEEEKAERMAEQQALAAAAAAPVAGQPPKKGANPGIKKPKPKAKAEESDE